MQSVKRVFGGFRQARSSKVTVSIDVDVPSGVSVSGSGHTATHTPPADGTVTNPTIEPSGNSVKVTFDAGDTAADVGQHSILALIALSDGQKWDCQLLIDVYA